MQYDDLSLLLRQGVGSDPRSTTQCPEDAEIAALVDEALGFEKAQRIRSHVAGCDFCMARVGFLARLRDLPKADAPAEALTHPSLLNRVRRLPDGERTASRPRWRWAAAAAAALVLVVLSVAQWENVQSLGEAPSEVRNGAALLSSPTILWPQEGLVISPVQLKQREFSWTPVVGATFYEILLVTADGERVWNSRVETERTRIPAQIEVAAGQEFFVWVRAYLPGGKSLQSGIVGFELSGGPARE